MARNGHPGHGELVELLSDKANLVTDNTISIGSY